MRPYLEFSEPQQIVNRPFSDGCLPNSHPVLGLIKLGIFHTTSQLACDPNLRFSVTVIMAADEAPTVQWEPSH